LRDLEEEARISHELTRPDNGTDPFAAAVRATRMPMLITDPRKDDNPIVFANASFSKLTGFSNDEIVGRNCRFLQGPDTDRAAVDKIRQAIAEPRPIEIELINYRKDGSRFWNRLLVSPVFDDDGALTYFFASQFDVTLERERLSSLVRDRDLLETQIARRDAELLASNERLSFALKAGRMGSWSLDLATMEMAASDGCKEIFGRPADEPFTYEDLQHAVHPDDRAMRDDAVAAAIRDGTPLDVEYRMQTPQGEERWVQIRGQASYRADGTPLVVAGVSQDITDRKRAEEHRALLANELSHRVKNSLATVQAVAAQTLRTAGSLAEAQKTLEARIQAMAAATNSLVTESWEGASLRDLLEKALAPFGTIEDARFQLSGPDIRLPPELAISFGLGVHELATNASKYGALSSAGGVVAISWNLSGDPGGKRLDFIWKESGGPAVSPPTKVGFGGKLIKRVLAQGTGSKVNIDYRPEGVIFSAQALLPDG